MVFIIPMAGRGSRFSKEGYTLPKYMIEVKGKTLFEYSLDSLPLEIADKIVFICLKEHETYNVSEFIKDKTSHDNIEIVHLDDITRGQAETALYAQEFVSSDEDILIYNIDTAFSSSSLKKNLQDTLLKKDGVIGTFIDRTPDDKWSFAKVDDNDNVICTAEKDKISHYALTGLYHFSKASDFFDIAKEWIKEDKTIKNEFYIAPMYNDLISEGKNYVLDIVDEFIPLGTPHEVKEFESKN